MNACARCGAPHAAHGLGPPAQREQQWFCADCVRLQPYHQDRLARQARAVIDDPEIIVR